ncbi:hypothetical protein MINS_00730 [Mycolicibacterium insubricum]|jgi:hypothetical protein|uniref:Uncharacterized protein n=1 Tax=Mycolicibacterium insubricum TaxID=444597 RepID=A0A1X0D5F1_9MYCO|nr:hypothetical protein [Mycolicibacterium insubricum]MCB0930059.1 hypothetical protein [Mycobacterium sp.]MCB9438988.1 hypothetical protein [Mycolicibacterium sp.]MCV7081161.1 hypothetical protein [Mycolicibacterium insubricum]ORA67646.1 hypothetical protein BST26_15650 [Mycolicibacterium insubricum]BBZ64644.1 hypothetical protein MINS_00730 [Mycolicibacterium insubricum]
MNRSLAAVGAAGLLAAGLAQAPSALAASNTAVRSVPVDDATSVEIHVTANCVQADGRCYFNTSANLLGPDGVTGFPDGTWARQTVTLRSNDRNVWQASEYSAPAGMPRETKGSDHDGVLSKQYKALTNVEISATYFGGGAPERFAIEGTSVPTDWTSGQPAFGPVFIACSVIQVTMGPVTVSTPTACAQTKFS